MSVRLLIADDHEVIRTGLVKLLEKSDMEIVAQAASGKECLKLAEQHKPDVILLDVRMPDGDGLETLEKLRQKVPHSKVVMLSFDNSPTHIARAVALGASDYLLKGSTRKAILDTLMAAAAGRSPSPAGELGRVADMMNSRQAIDDGEIHLTPRESQTVRNLSLGLSNREISCSLEISVETVKEHVQNVLRKLAVKDRTQAAVWAVRKGLV